MSSKPARQCPLVMSLLGILAIVVATTTGAATLEQETATKIEQIRAIKAWQNSATMATYNQEMDAAWQYYSSHRPDVLPILRAQLKAEIAREQPSDLVLLDVGLFIHENDSSEGKTLARQALFRLNPRAAIVNENWKELFELVHGAAEDHDARVIDLIDRNFLTSDQKIFIPQHALQLDGTLICVFLYGTYGTDAETHLREKLQDHSVTRRVLELLVWLGSPDSVNQVGEVLSGSPNYETFSRVTAFMMQAGGPAGRDFMLKLDASKLDPQSREYLSKIHSAIQTMSFETIRGSLAGFPGDKKLADPEVKLRIQAMIANYGQDDRTSPLAILDSALGPDSLIASLLKVRSRSLYRLSDEALSDVEVTNTLVNALRYRNH
ncbi:MAG TPA: hypothetical protein VNZ53_07595 [Steroidobacteraceae bacterium]|nr:hypothetical protein [Steroidobacteraceae bacterium]